MLQQLTSLTDLGSMVRFSATAPVVCANIVAVLQQLTHRNLSLTTDLGSMVRFPATAPVVCAFFVPDLISFRDRVCSVGVLVLSYPRTFVAY